MSTPIFITDPVVAAAYGVHPAEFVAVEDPLEAAWLVTQHHGYSLSYGSALPAAYYVHPDAPLPFKPYAVAGPSPAPEPSPAPSPTPAPKRARSSGGTSGQA